MIKIGSPIWMEGENTTGYWEDLEISIQLDARKAEDYLASKLEAAETKILLLRTCLKHAQERLKTLEEK